VSRVAILCPGRGSYTENSLGSLPREHEWVQAADRLRGSLGLESLLDLDGAEKFEPARHLRPANISALIYLVSMLDGARVLAKEDVTCIAGNSMGWYTALALGGALSFEHGFELVQKMALFQEEVAGGQIIYPVVDEDWHRDPELEEHVRSALTGDGEVFPSITLGGYVVFAGSAKGISRLLQELPKVELGKNRYPIRLAQHGPYHTPLAEPVAARARRELAGLEFQRPHTTLIDGHGRRHTPWSADQNQLRAYTFGAQVTQPYDFTASVRVALCEHAPERLTLLGPGNTLGGICGQILIETRWQGIHARDDFQRVQASDAPLVDSLQR